jgi:hypothetical protein
MSYAIMRIRKIKSYTEIANAEKHNIRAKEIEHISQPDSKLIFGYLDVKEKVKVLVKTVEKLQKKKLRKDAVKCLEIITTSDKEFFEKVNIDAWINKNLEYIIRTYGKENICQATLHKDESAQHIHFLVTPIFQNSFNAKHWLAGRQAVINMQNEYFEHMKEFGLQRGKSIEQTNAKHTEAKEFRRLKRENDNYKRENEKLFEYIEKQYIKAYKKKYDSMPKAFEIEYFKTSLKDQIIKSTKDDKKLNNYIDTYLKKEKEDSLEL